MTLSEKTREALEDCWEIRLRVNAEGDRLRAKGGSLYEEGTKLVVASHTLWDAAILEYCGDIKVKWENWNQKLEQFECHLETGEVFVPRKVWP